MKKTSEAIGLAEYYIYRISQDSNHNYDTYDSAIVAAESEEKARLIHPGGDWDKYSYCWCKTPDLVKVEYIGRAVKRIRKGIILSSFNAG